MIYFSTFATCSQLLWVIRIQVSVLTGRSVVGQHWRSIQKAGISIFGIVQVNREASLRSSARRIRFSYPGVLKQALGILSGEVGNLLSAAEMADLLEMSISRSGHRGYRSHLWALSVSPDYPVWSESQRGKVLGISKRWRQLWSGKPSVRWKWCFLPTIIPSVY